MFKTEEEKLKEYKEALASGKITKGEFDKLVKQLETIRKMKQI